MRVLVLNCGSSSVKAKLFAMDTTSRVLARGSVERLGARATLSVEPMGGAARRETLPIADDTAAVRHLLDGLDAAASGIDAVGHRVVHGGDRFTAPVVIEDAVLAALDGLADLAPLHNAPGVAGIRAARAALPGVPMVAAFDTAFHATLPERAWRYAIPVDLADRHRARRYGFHGLSCRAVLARYAELSDTPIARTTLVVLHLGSGCSATAVSDGRSVDTSMGLTPLEGLVMGTRSGDVDPALTGYLVRATGSTHDDVEHWLNERSGLLGLSGTTADMRDLLARAADDPRAALAIDVFCYRARKYVGAYLAALGGAQAVIFTGGVGERAPEIRRRICEGLAWCGLGLDPLRNAAAIGVEAPIAAEGARIGAWVIPTDEERVIAADVVECLAASSAGPRR